jgi:hypothetical protein
VIEFVIGFFAGAVCAAVVPYVGDLGRWIYAKIYTLDWPRKKPDDTDQAGA